MPRWLLPNQPLGQTFSARLVCSKGVVQPGIVDRAAVAVVVQKLIVVVGNNVSVVTPVLLPLPLLSALLGRSVYELHDDDVVILAKYFGASCVPDAGAERILALRSRANTRRHHNINFCEQRTIAACNMVANRLAELLLCNSKFGEPRVGLLAPDRSSRI